MFGITEKPKWVQSVEKLFSPPAEIPEMEVAAVDDVPPAVAYKIQELLWKYSGRWVIATNLYHEAKEQHGISQGQLSSQSRSYPVLKFDRIKQPKLPANLHPTEYAVRAHARGKSVWYIGDVKHPNPSHSPNGTSVGQNHPGNSGRWQGF